MSLLCRCTTMSACVRACVRLACVRACALYQTVLPPCWQAIAMQAHIQTHPNKPSSWPRGQCSCLAHNSDWLEYQRPELNPKQLLTRDIKQSGESSCGDFMIPPGRRVLARTVVLFNTIPSKQLITRGSRRVTLLHLTVLQEETVNQMIKLHDSAEETRLVSPFFHGIVFLFFLGGFNRYPHHFFFILLL